MTSCRLCASNDLRVVLSLGSTPLANALLTVEDLETPDAVYPLALAICGSCSLVQITESVPPEELFAEYVYFSSFSETMVRHARDLAAAMRESRRLDGNSLVIEAASNDGYLLQHYRAAGIPVLGIEPAANIAKVAREQRQIPTLTEFFSREVAERVAGDGKRADVFHAHNVLAHVPDLNGFVAGIRSILRDDGVAVIEVPYVKDMIDRCEFDTIYHEHLCYFSLTALNRLFKLHDLDICRVERLAIHGGSLRIVAARSGAARRDRSVNDLLADEQSWGAATERPYLEFGQRVGAIRRQVSTMLEELKAAGNRLAAYGAAAKGSTLLNCLPLKPGLIDFVVDRSTYKQGRYMPGVRLPIYPPEKLLEARPDYVLLLTWNFADEILEQQARFRELGGRFLLPIPEPRIL